MAGAIKIDTGKLRSDIQSVQGDLGELKNEIVRLRETAASLGAMWEGEAKTAFMAALEEDIRKLELLVTEVEKYTSKTDDARKGYENCENSVAQIIQSIKV